jgi:hypothetical protein
VDHQSNSRPFPLKSRRRPSVEREAGCFRWWGRPFLSSSSNWADYSPVRRSLSSRVSTLYFAPQPSDPSASLRRHERLKGLRQASDRGNNAHMLSVPMFAASHRRNELMLDVLQLALQHSATAHNGLLSSSALPALVATRHSFKAVSPRNFARYSREAPSARLFSTGSPNMASNKIDGTAIAKKIRDRLASEIAEKKKHNAQYQPSLKIIQGS